MRKKPDGEEGLYPNDHLFDALEAIDQFFHPKDKVRNLLDRDRRSVALLKALDKAHRAYPIDDWEDEE